MEGPKVRYADRFVPMRAANSWNILFPITPPLSEKENEAPVQSNDNITPGKYSLLLRNELLGYQIKDGDEKQAEDQFIPDKKLFHFDIRERPSTSPSSYSSSPLSDASNKLLQSKSMVFRRRFSVSTRPLKILEAPNMEADFYLNLLDWSSKDVIAVGLENCVYLWTNDTEIKRVFRLYDAVTSVSWSQKGNILAMGTEEGRIVIYDAEVEKKISSIKCHRGRVATTAWNSNLIASGSRDRFIYLNDIRTPALAPVCKFERHRQEVCGLKWSPDNQFLASGGNDNLLYIWNMHSTSPVQTYKDHTAAVKAIAWSPHNRGILASGGGAKDHHIRLWNTNKGQSIRCVDAQSQVTNLAWSSHYLEFVSTHGYPSQIAIWNYPTLQKTAEIKTRRQHRVLYLAKSPNSEQIVTGLEDHTLRFWNVFRKGKPYVEEKSVLRLDRSIR